VTGRRNANKKLRGSILWVDGKRASGSDFIPELREKGLTIVTVPTGKAALARLKTFDPHVIVVDAESMRSSGLRICRSLHSAVDGRMPLILIATPGRPVVQGPSMRFKLDQPFTIRKICNRIKALLPSDGNNLLTRGAITLDTRRNIAIYNGRDTQLTPRLAGLLKMLMKRPGSVIRRETLFKKIWNTDYIGDTRTLDVHVSWLRKAIEENPRKPQHLKTIRGVGYRLDP